MTIHLGWFTAGRGPGSRGMFERTLAAIDDGSVDASIEFVFMQRERGEGEGSDRFIDLAESHGIPVENLSSLRFRREHGGNFAANREEYDTQVAEIIAHYEVDSCVLAGYLLILSPVLIAAQWPRWSLAASDLDSHRPACGRNRKYDVGCDQQARPGSPARLRSNSYHRRRV